MFKTKFVLFFQITKVRSLLYKSRISFIYSDFPKIQNFKQIFLILSTLQTISRWGWIFNLNARVPQLECMWLHDCDFASTCPHMTSQFASTWAYMTSRFSSNAIHSRPPSVQGRSIFFRKLVPNILQDKFPLCWSPRPNEKFIEFFFARTGKKCDCLLLFISTRQTPIGKEDSWRFRVKTGEWERGSLAGSEPGHSRILKFSILTRTRLHVPLWSYMGGHPRPRGYDGLDAFNRVRPFQENSRKQFSVFTAERSTRRRGGCQRMYLSVAIGHLCAFLGCHWAKRGHRWTSSTSLSLSRSLGSRRGSRTLLDVQRTFHVIDENILATDT